MAYECKEGWEIGFEACVCPKKDQLQEMIKVIETNHSDVPFCCNSSYLTEIDYQRNILSCPLGSDDDSRTCKSKWKRTYGWDGKIQIMPDNATVEDYCIGPSWTFGSIEKGVVMAEYECPIPCGGIR